MSKRRQRMIKVISSVILAGVVICFTLWSVSRIAFDKEKAVSRMNADWNEISLIKDFLVQVDQPLVILRRGDGVKDSYHELSGREVFPMNCTEAYEAAKHLIFEEKYKSITKYENYIAFLMWSRFTDAGRGIVYSIDGREPVISYLTKLEPLNRPGWYYYEQ